MDEVLRQALEPILCDLRSAGIRLPRVVDDWPYPTSSPGAGEGMVLDPDGTGATGIWADGSAPEFERVAMVADQLQDIAIEGRWVPTNWPPCPHHPDKHPLVVSAHERRAVWICPVDEVLIAPVGML
ncbi:hypothetical protein SAMN05421678_109257 [Actinopolymorpha cephalotaxi]|uniref:Uncharacterized protein n=1 Tax=Actinopolymorpha cephalotaxi TaxID=504797 RepID=A0A1I2VMK6_9ACTN|nr:hypothetical protein [Actinopolymorpha cephalotaxi]NYH83249.1 hypothetical protein [Actinopolymorpha cephalotaxi]SFG90554.1 hypothetical protein SAMN05421678_109257 [Actinopolymorpha cephalotaxi]